MAKTFIDAALLYRTLDAVRKQRQLSWRALAGTIGVSPSLLSRLGNGYKPDADGFATLVKWLRVPAESFFTTGLNEQQRVDEPDLMAQLAPLLRARKDLDERDIRYLQQVIGATVERAQAKD